MRPRLRNEQAGATYHVMARGVDRTRIFLDDEDYERYTNLLGGAVERQRWHLLAYCLMPNHVHLLLETPKTNLGNGMQWLQSRYAKAFNTKYARAGHRFEARYLSPMVLTEGKLVRTVAYIAANPVVAYLCDDPAEWAWCSHRAVAKNEAPTWLAHRRLTNRMASAPGAPTYEELIRYGVTTW